MRFPWPGRFQRLTGRAGLTPGRAGLAVASHFPRWDRLICDMVPVSPFCAQVMAPVGRLTPPLARTAAIPGLNTGRLAVTPIGCSRAALLNPWLDESTPEAG
jgi:hypothetical protein